MARRALAGAPSDGRERMWQAMRLQPAFRVQELIGLCGVKRKAAEKFLRPLVRAGYLRAEGAGPARRYALIRDTGSVPPRAGRSGVFDVNEAIARDRARYVELIKEVRQIEERLIAYGAYVEKFQERN
ncbi:MAG: hypothetical protein WBY93_17925 [Candidatus Binatus sp.]